MLEFLKTLMGRQKKARRPTLDLAKLNAPVEAARLKLEAVQADHAALLERHREHKTAETVASAAFETSGDDETADKLVELSRERAKHELFKARSQRTVDRAAAAHQEAEATRDATVLATLDSIYDGAATHIRAEWEASGKAALATFAAFLRETDAILNEAETAMRESCRLRGDDTAWMKARGLDCVRGAVGIMIKDSSGADFERVLKTIR